MQTMQTQARVQVLMVRLSVCATQRTRQSGDIVAYMLVVSGIVALLVVILLTFLSAASVIQIPKSAIAV